jgi:hypothetical protein
LLASWLSSWLVPAAVASPLCYARSGGPPADVALPSLLRFGAEASALMLDGEACVLLGQREQHAQRAYLDLACGDAGRRVDLDVNFLPGGRLLVAVRPLGQAEFYDAVPCSPVP